MTNNRHRNVLDLAFKPGANIDMVDGTPLYVNGEPTEQLLAMARQVNDEFEKIHTGMSEIFARALDQK